MSTFPYLYWVTIFVSYCSNHWLIVTWYILVEHNDIVVNNKYGITAADLVSPYSDDGQVSVSPVHFYTAKVAGK